jgi:hypothetical protein
MADDAIIRLENFRALWTEPFSPTDAALRLWGGPSQWSDLYRGKKSFGEKLARRIEEKLGLARLSLDRPTGAKTAPLSAEVMNHLASLDALSRAHAENVLRVHLGLAPLPAAFAPPEAAPRKRQA